MFASQLLNVIMNKLHKDKINIKKVEPKEGQRVSLCSNKVLSRCPSLSYNQSNLQQESLDRAFDLLFEAMMEVK